MKVDNCFRSSDSFPASTALELTGLSCDYMPVQEVRGEHTRSDFPLRLHEMRVSCLEIVGHGPTPSMAIIECLEATRFMPTLRPSSCPDGGL